MAKKSSTLQPFIIIPIFNEGKVVGKFLDEVKKAGYKNIIVIDDGSTDNSFEIAQSKGAYTLRHVVNRGKGAAMMTGFEAATLLNADAVITMDGDGQHNPKDIKGLIDGLDEGFDAVLGTRVMTFKNSPFWRVVANFIGNFVTYLFYGIWVQDSQGGMRAYNQTAYQAIDIKNDRYEYDSEVIREIARHKLTFKEIPITVRYTTYSTTKPNHQTIINGFRMLLRMFLSA
jgi:UDP-N-acetylglucosamine---dolichyl-phosphate N-acetylglucosaminyltransferase